MFNLICRTLLHSSNGYSFRAYNSSSMAVSLSLIRYLSSGADNQHSFTVNYLINSCGLSPKSAFKASKAVQFNNLEKPDLILAFFEKQGFSKPQIADIITKCPKYLSMSPHKLFPKVEFLSSKGASTSDLVGILKSNRFIPCVSLENNLVPCFNYLAEVLQSEGYAIEVMKRFHCNMSVSSLIHIVGILAENGVPAANISYAIRRHLNCILMNPVNFRVIVEEIKEMGFNPSRMEFVSAIASFAGRTKSTRDKKVGVFKRWGWSGKDITSAIKKHPWCMAYSEDKIMAAMDFYVNKTGLESSVIAHNPVLLGFSLKRRLIPRGAVIQFLRSKGLLKSASRMSPMFICSEKSFFEKYVSPHRVEAPLLIDLYNDRLNEAINEE